MNRSTLMILLFGALLLTGLFLLMRPAQEPVTASLDLPARIVDFAVTDGQLAEGPAVVSVIEGTPVTLRALWGGCSVEITSRDCCRVSRGQFGTTIV